MSRSACTCDVFLQFHLNITLCREHMSYIKCYIFVLNFTWTLHCTCIFQLLLNDYLCHPVFVTLQHSSLGGKVRSFSSWIYLFLFLTFPNSFSSCPCVNLYTRAFIYWYFFPFYLCYGANEPDTGKQGSRPNLYRDKNFRIFFVLLIIFYTRGFIKLSFHNTFTR